MIDSINQKLNEMRIASTNSGGYYHFKQLKLPKASNLSKQIKNYLNTIPAYYNPTIILDGKKVIVQDRSIENLKLSPIAEIENVIDEKLLYWKEHRTTLDSKSEVATEYSMKEEIFKVALFDFLNSKSNLKAYQLEGLDTSFTRELGGDHVGDEIIFESGDGIYVLHFGWSS